MLPRDRLRREGRRARREIPDRRRRDASLAVSATLGATAPVADAHHVALYRAGPEELDPAPFAEAARARGQRTWYPVVVGARLEFGLWDGHTALRTGKFGIEVPPPGPTREPDELDVVIVPVVGFDRAGGRLGLGAGYYDRTFGFRHAEPAPPLLVGLAFAEQEVEPIPLESWDVPLDAVVTPDGWIDCRR